MVKCYLCSAWSGNIYLGKTHLFCRMSFECDLINGRSLYASHNPYTEAQLYNPVSFHFYMGTVCYLITNP
jgi:hypothetical protein